MRFRRTYFLILVFILPGWCAAQTPTTVRTISNMQSPLQNQTQTQSQSAGLPIPNDTTNRHFDPTDSPDSASVSYSYQNVDAAYWLHPVALPIAKIQDYTKLQRSPETFADLGNSGSAYKPTFFYFPEFSNFNFGIHSFDAYRLLPDSLRYFHAQKPYTELDFMMGRAKELKLNLIHSQHVYKGLSLGVQARFTSSPGLYLQQMSNYRGVAFNGSYHTPNKRYGLLAHYLNDRFYAQENGGIIYDSVFTDNTESNRKAILVNLNDAQNKNRTASVFLQQYFNLRKPQPVVSDSIHPVSRTRFDFGRLVHTFQYQRETWSYFDNQIPQNFYPNIYSDSLKTADSLSWMQVSNTLVYTNIVPDTASRQFPFQYSFGITYQYHKLYFTDDSTATSTNFTQIYPFATLKGVIGRKTFFTATGKLSLSDYTAGDFNLSGNFYQFFGDKNNGKISLTASMGQNNPAYYYKYYYSNSFRWDRELSTQPYQTLQFGVEFKGYQATVRLQRISNYTYFNSSIEPTQYEDPCSVAGASFSKVFNWRNWKLDASLSWQQSSNDTVISLPDFAAKTAVSYNVPMFQGALHIQFGVALSYNTAYYADAYMPALRAFYSQQELKTGNYPYLDVFANLRIKRARLFLKYQHLNSWFGNYNYFMVPHYPGADAAFKFGVNWVFYD